MTLYHNGTKMHRETKTRESYSLHFQCIQPVVLYSIYSGNNVRNCVTVCDSYRNCMTFCDSYRNCMIVSKLWHFQSVSETELQLQNLNCVTVTVCVRNCITGSESMLWQFQNSGIFSSYQKGLMAIILHLTRNPIFDPNATMISLLPHLIVDTMVG